MSSQAVYYYYLTRDSQKNAPKACVAGSQKHDTKALSNVEKNPDQVVTVVKEE